MVKFTIRFKENKLFWVVSRSGPQSSNPRTLPWNRCKLGKTVLRGALGIKFIIFPTWEEGFFNPKMFVIKITPIFFVFSPKFLKGFQNRVVEGHYLGIIPK